MRICSIDIETCGLDHEKNDILEFGAVLDDFRNETPLNKLPTFHCYFVKDMYIGQPYALSMHHVIFRRIADREYGFNYVRANKFGNLFKQFLIKNGYEEKHSRVTINVAGKNFGSLDQSVLRLQTDIEKHVDLGHKFLDPAQFFIEKGDETLLGLGGCKERAGFRDKNVDHTAVSDAMDVVRLLRHTIGRSVYGNTY